MRTIEVLACPVYLATRIRNRIGLRAAGYFEDWGRALGLRVRAWLVAGAWLRDVGGDAAMRGAAWGDKL